MRKKRFGILGGIVIIAMLSMAMGVYAGASSSTLDQCANGAIGGAHTPCADNSTLKITDWINGNLGGSKAHYAEGQFIPYRIILSGLTAGPHNAQIEYAVTKGTKHAIDYLGTFSATETLALGNDPCGDQIPGCDPANPTSVLPILLANLNGFPPSSGLNTFTGTEIPGQFSMWNGTLVNMSYVFQNVIDNGDFKTQVSINFTIPNASSGSTVILSWGGHVAKASDWGVGNSSSTITGSPYHMINVLLDGATVGAQDRSLSTSAILPTLTVFKFVNNDGSPIIHVPGDWTMIVSNCIGNCSFPGNSSGTEVSVNASSPYNVTETPFNFAGYNGTFSSGCSGSLAAGTTATCIVNNNFSGTTSLILNKTAFPLTYNATGQIITYTYTVTNTGTTTITGNISVNDTIIGTINPCGSTPLNPGSSTNCTAKYTIKQSDIQNGSVTNVATATAGGNTTPPATTTVTAIQEPIISLVKTVNVSTYNKGDVILYTYNITNNGNVNLGEINVTDNITGTISPCISGGLTVNSSGTCTATTTATQSDVNNGSITNLATASTIFNGSTILSNPASTTVKANQAPAILLNKTAFPPTYDHVGENITYTYTITNSGTITLPGPFNITDNKTGLIDPCGKGPLDPGASTSCTANYTITLQDLNNGSVTNSAFASTDGIQSPPVTTTVTAIQSPTISLVKTANVSTYSNGSVILYTYNITNTGNVNLGEINVTDNITGIISPCISGGLTVGQSGICTATTTATQFDVDNGSITNNATASTIFNGNTVLSNPASTTVTAIQIRHLSFVKSGALNITGGVYNYVINATNDGTVTLHISHITDPNMALTCSPFTDLPPGSTTSCSGTSPAISTPFNTNTTITMVEPDNTLVV